MFLLLDSFTAMTVWVRVGWAIGLTLGAVVLAWIYLVSGRSVTAVALWHVGYNYVSAAPASAGMVAAIVSTAVMLSGLLIVWRWVTKPPHRLEKSLS